LQRKLPKIVGTPDAFTGHMKQSSVGMHPERDMFRKPQPNDTLTLGPDEGKAKFDRADVLFALEWSALAPGIGGWDVLIDDERMTRLVSVVPPGADAPAFFIYWKGSEIVLTWQALNGKGEMMEVARFTNLRAAVLALCPLSEDQHMAVKDSMEIMYPRSLRSN
jgi:hypothetical protein